MSDSGMCWKIVGHNGLWARMITLDGVWSFGIMMVSCLASCKGSRSFDSMVVVGGHRRRLVGITCRVLDGRDTRQVTLSYYSILTSLVE